MAFVGYTHLLFLFSFLCEAVDAGYYCYTYYNYYSSYSTYYCYYDYYVPVGTIIGAVVGAVAFIVIIIGVIVFFCCIRRGRQATTGRVITNTGHVTVMSSNTGGYINTGTYPPGAQITTQYPPGMQASYPQYTYPQQAAGFPQQQASTPSESQPPQSVQPSE